MTIGIIGTLHEGDSMVVLMMVVREDSEEWDRYNIGCKGAIVLERNHRNPGCQGDSKVVGSDDGPERSLPPV